MANSACDALRLYDNSSSCSVHLRLLLFSASLFVLVCNAVFSCVKELWSLSKKAQLTQ